MNNSSLLYCQGVGIGVLMDSTTYHANSAVTSPSMPMLLKVKIVNLDHIGCRMYVIGEQCNF